MKEVGLSLAWPAVFVPQPEGTVLVEFPDIPEALTEGDNEDDAYEQAADCLAEAIAGRINRREEVPMPSSAKRGRKEFRLNRCWPSKPQSICK